jgi:hypothetical protein
MTLLPGIAIGLLVGIPLGVLYLLAELAGDVER